MMDSTTTTTTTTTVTTLPLALAVAALCLVNDANAFIPAVPSLRSSANRVATPSRQRSSSSFLPFQSGDDNIVVGTSSTHTSSTDEGGFDGDTVPQLPPPSQIQISTSYVSNDGGRSIVEAAAGDNTNDDDNDNENDDDPSTTIISIPVAPRQKIVLPPPVTSTSPPTTTTSSFVEPASTEPLQFTELHLPVKRDNTKPPSSSITAGQRWRSSVSSWFHNTKQRFLSLLPWSSSSLSSSSKHYILRPGMRFRLRLGLATLAGVSLTTFFFPATRRLQLLHMIQKWIATRGFQGLSAFGRTVAYGWAVFVGYPRLLDRRVAEGRKRDDEKRLERRRAYLKSLAAEVVRFRQELATIDTEIRSFRREIITLKAYSKDQDPDVQEAIRAEMAHLAQLRSDTQAALAAARQAWAEARSKSPPEVFDDDDLVAEEQQQQQQQQQQQTPIF